MARQRTVRVRALQPENSQPPPHTTCEACNKSMAVGQPSTSSTHSYSKQLDDTPSSYTTLTHYIAMFGITTPNAGWHSSISTIASSIMSMRVVTYATLVSVNIQYSHHHLLLILGGRNRLINCQPLIHKTIT